MIAERSGGRVGSIWEVAAVLGCAGCRTRSEFKTVGHYIGPGNRADPRQEYGPLDDRSVWVRVLGQDANETGRHITAGSIHQTVHEERKARG